MLQKTREECAEGLRHAAEADSPQAISAAGPADAAQGTGLPSRNDAHTVLANTPFLLTRCSSDLRYVFASEAYARMLGHRPEDLAGKKIIEVIGEAAFQTILPHMNAVLAGRHVEYEKEVHYKGIAPRLVHVIYTPDKDEFGQVVGWVASIIDITDAADVHATILLRDVSSECVRDDATLNHCLQLILDAGIVIAKAQKGTLQVLDPPLGSLRIAAQRGFEQHFLDFFKDAHLTASACGAALQCRNRIIVEDVLTSEIFLHEPSQEVLLHEDVRAVISTPIVSSHGQLLGMLTTHFNEPHQPHARELHLTDLLARLAGDYLERKQAREIEKLLLREIQHRSNNLLSVVQAISQYTFAGANSLYQVKRGFEGRLLALAQCNKLITNSTTGGVLLREIVRLQVEPFAGQIALEGSDLIISSQHAQNISLLLHELVTNAAKHGALKETSGRVAISWIIDRSKRALRLKWRERGGPTVVFPRRTGFGTKLLKATFPAAQVDYAPEGVQCQIEIQIGTNALSKTE